MECGTEKMDLQLYHNNGDIKAKIYYVNDQLHRSDGPAGIFYYEDSEIIEEEFYLYGIECDILQEMVIRGLEKL